MTASQGLQYRLHEALAVPRRHPHRQPWRQLPYTLIEQIDTGTYVVTAEGESIDVGDGAAFIVPPRMRHKLEIPRGVSCTVRWIHADFILDSGNDLFSVLQAPLVLDVPLGRKVGALMARIAASWSPDPAVTLRRAIAQQERLARLAGILLDGSPSLRSATDNLVHDKIAPVLTFIRDNLHRPLSRAQLARVAGLSPTRFHYVFESEMGRAPMVYVRDLRLVQAKQLLIQTTLGIQQIAERVGFNDAYYFSRVFRKSTGQTPSGYRREMLSE